MGQQKSLSDQAADAASQEARRQGTVASKSKELESNPAANYMQTGNSRDTAATSAKTQFHTQHQHQESSFANTTGQTLDSMNGAYGGPSGGAGCQWWQNNYVSFRNRMKHDIGKAGAAEGSRPVNLLKMKNGKQ